MINNINDIIKIDYSLFCEVIKDSIKTIYDLSDDDVENLPLDLPTIIAWANKVQEDDLIEHLKNDDLQYVIDHL